jgi:hypothetical protein
LLLLQFWATIIENQLGNAYSKHSMVSKGQQLEQDKATKEEIEIKKKAKGKKHTSEQM